MINLNILVIVVNIFEAFCLQCKEYSSLSCQLEDNCGWCETTSKCMDYTTIDKTCEQYTKKVQKCSHDSKDFCTSDCDCGWCESDQKCYLGYIDGPLVGNTCSMSKWTYNKDSCPVCSSYSSPSSCLNNGCGWCNSNSKCLSKNSRLDKETQKDCAAWYDSSSDCVTNESQDKCKSQCLCGWCSAKNQCLPRDIFGNGPSGESCASGWSYSPCVVDSVTKGFFHAFVAGLSMMALIPILIIVAIVMAIVICCCVCCRLRGDRSDRTYDGQVIQMVRYDPYVPKETP